MVMVWYLLLLIGMQLQAAPGPIGPKVVVGGPSGGSRLLGGVRPSVTSSADGLPVVEDVASSEQKFLVDGVLQCDLRTKPQELGYYLNELIEVSSADIALFERSKVWFGNYLKENPTILQDAQEKAFAGGFSDPVVSVLFQFDRIKYDLEGAKDASVKQLQDQYNALISVLLVMAENVPDFYRLEDKAGDSMLQVLFNAFFKDKNKDEDLTANESRLLRISDLTSSGSDFNFWFTQLGKDTARIYLVSDADKVYILKQMFDICVDNEARLTLWKNIHKMSLSGYVKGRAFTDFFLGLKSRLGDMLIGRINGFISGGYFPDVQDVDALLVDRADLQSLGLLQIGIVPANIHDVAAWNVFDLHYYVLDRPELLASEKAVIYQQVFDRLMLIPISDLSQEQALLLKHLVFVKKVHMQEHVTQLLKIAIKKGLRDLTRFLFSKLTKPERESFVRKNTMLFNEAADYGDLNTLKIFLDVDPNLASGPDAKALIGAVSNGYPDTVRMLLDHNANPNLKNGLGETLLDLAVSEGHADIVRMLFDHNADPNLKNVLGQTLLHLAIRDGDTDTASMLLDYKADPNLRDHFGLTPLRIAVDRGHADIVDELLRRGANIRSLSVGDLHMAMKCYSGVRDVIVRHQLKQFGIKTIGIASHVGKAVAKVYELSRGGPCIGSDTCETEIEKKLK